MTTKMKITIGMCFVAVLCAALAVSCTDNDTEEQKEFTSRPMLELTNGPTVDSVKYEIKGSDPRADSYDLFWVVGVDYNTREQLLRGNREQRVREGTIPGFSPGTIVKAMAVAKKSGYGTANAYSGIEVFTVGGGSGGPPDVPPGPNIGSKSTKRGVGYDFTTRSRTQKNTTVGTETDMDALMGGLNGINWFYSWGLQPNTAVINAANARNLEFAPMAWNNSYQDSTVAAIKKSMPGTQYLLAFNEPNFPDQSNMTPLQAANAWPKFRKAAKDNGLKLISPAMNYAGPGNMGPIAWLDEFFRLIGAEAAAEIEAISVHSYAWFANAIMQNEYKKYNKPLWITEFCGWEDIQTNWRTPSWQLQAWYMSQTLVYLEADPMTARYAWYLPKGHVNEIGNTPGVTTNPFHNLLKDGSSELTQLGILFTNMTVLDKSVWVPAGRKIDASQFTDCNVTRTTTWSDIVISFPTNDTDTSAGPLDIRGFTNNKWVEYQVELSSAKAYTMTLRYRTARSTNLRISVDGTRIPVGSTASDTTINSADWAETTINMGNLTAGKHTIRLLVNGGNGSVSSGTDSCAANFLDGGAAINWLRID